MPLPRALSVLIVDDHPDAGETLAEFLRLRGHQTRVAHTGQEAVEVVESFPADAVILDVGLPGADGYAVARRLCEASERRPLLVAVTGYVHLDERSRSEGFDHHFLKPVDPCCLADALARHAARLQTGLD